MGAVAAMIGVEASAATLAAAEKMGAVAVVRTAVASATTAAVEKMVAVKKGAVVCAPVAAAVVAASKLSRGAWRV